LVPESSDEQAVSRVEGCDIVADEHRALKEEDDEVLVYGSSAMEDDSDNKG
jgi:hypothetical protein